MALTNKNTWTYQDYLTLEQDKRFEIIQGALTEMSPSPSFHHQQVSAKLFVVIYDFVKNHNLGIVAYAPLDVILSDNNVLQPDMVYIANENTNLIKKNGIFGLGSE